MALVERRALYQQRLVSHHRPFQPFPTVLDTDDVPIVAFSDIHGDMDALIVCLRDCARVIRRRREYPSNPPEDPGMIHIPEFDARLRDEQLEMFLQMDINDQRYRRDVGYEWVKGNKTIVVILGDLIDPLRRKNGVMESKEQLYYPQLELKILHFINAINEDSNLKSEDEDYGRIFKLVGNHDVQNFINDRPAIEFGRDHSFQQDVDTNYYTSRGVLYTRSNVFHVGNPGFQLYLQTTGTGILMKIHDNLFVHGGIPPQKRGHPLTIHEMMIMNQTINKEIPFSEETIRDFFSFLDYRGISESNSVSDRKCRYLSEDIEDFCNDPLYCGNTPNQLRLFVGHCKQHEMYDTSTLSHFIETNGRTETYSNYEHRERQQLVSAYHHGSPEYSDSHNRIFGISLSCDRIDNNSRGGRVRGRDDFQPQLIKIDVAMGRGQNGNDEMDRFAFTRRVPQIVRIPFPISNPAKLELIRSTVHHMAIHMPRPRFAKEKSFQLAFSQRAVEQSISNLAYFNHEIKKQKQSRKRRLMEQLEKERIYLKEYKQMENSIRSAPYGAKRKSIKRKKK